MRVPLSVQSYADPECLHDEAYVARLIADLQFDYSDQIESLHKRTDHATDERADQDLRVVRLREAEIVIDWLLSRYAAIKATTTHKPIPDRRLVQDASDNRADNRRVSKLP